MGRFSALFRAGILPRCVRGAVFPAVGKIDKLEIEMGREQLLLPLESDPEEDPVTEEVYGRILQARTVSQAAAAFRSPIGAGSATEEPAQQRKYA